MAFGEERTQSGSRAFVRAVFALIEGGVFGLKQVAITLSEHGQGQFSEAEMAMLKDELYDLDKKGRATVQPKFVPLPKNIRFAFEACGRAYNTSYVLPVNDSGWHSFQEALKVRNRLTHPKSIDDLQLTEKELEQASEAAKWFLRQHAQLTATIERTVHGIANEMLTRLLAYPFLNPLISAHEINYSEPYKQLLIYALNQAANLGRYIRAVSSTLAQMLLFRD